MTRFGRFYRVALTTVWTTVFLTLPLSAVAERLPNDEYFDTQWYLQKVGAPKAWESSLGFEGIVVALIDTGVDLDHPDLRDNIWRNYDEIPGNGIDDDRNGYIDDVQGWDFVDHDADPRSSLTSGDTWESGVSHGTVSAGVIAARGDNDIGISGITWQTTIMPIRALDKFGHGDPVSVVQAVEYAVQNGADVINLALAGSVEDDLLRIALRHAYDAGVFVVAAAGNAPDGFGPINLDDSPRYPVCLDFGADENFVYGVAATDEDDKHVDFSNFGAGCVDLSAPGYRYVGTVPYRPSLTEFSEAYRGYFNGTSVAASLVSGAVALIKAMNPHLTPKQIANLLTATAVQIDDKNPEYYGRLGRGRLDVAAAVSRLKSERRVVESPVSTSSLVPDGRVSGLIAAASGIGRENEVRLFTSDGALVRYWRPFAEGFRGGADLAVGDFDGMGRRTLVAAAGPGGAPQIRIFDINSVLIGGFLAYDSKFRGGISVATGDLDGDGIDEIVTVPKGGGGPHVRIFTSRGVAIGGFFAFDKEDRDGWTVEVRDLTGDDKAEIIVMNSLGDRIMVFSSQGEVYGDFWATRFQDEARVRLSFFDADGDGLPEIGVHQARASGESIIAYDLSGHEISRLESLDGKTPDFGRGDVIGAWLGGAPIIRWQRDNGELFGFQTYEARFTGGVSAVMIE